jgi:hypothetical protein
MPWRTNPGLTPESAGAMERATRLRERLGAWTGGDARLEEGRLVVTLPPRSMFVWTP